MAGRDEFAFGCAVVTPIAVCPDCVGGLLGAVNSFWRGGRTADHPCNLIMELGAIGSCSVVDEVAAGALQWVEVWGWDEVWSAVGGVHLDGPLAFVDLAVVQFA